MLGDDDVVLVDGLEEEELGLPELGLPELGDDWLGLVAGEHLAVGGQSTAL